MHGCMMHATVLNIEVCRRPRDGQGNIYHSFDGLPALVAPCLTRSYMLQPGKVLWWVWD